MACRCGREFCYKCGGIYGKCECKSEIHVGLRPRPMVRPIVPRHGKKKRKGRQ